MTRSKNHVKAMLAAVGVYTLWGFSFLASKLAQESATPFVLIAYRFDLAVLVLSIPVILGKVKIRLRGKNIKPLLLLGAMEPCIYFIGEQYGLRYTNSAFSGLMIAVIPIVTLIMAAAFLKDRPSRAQWLFSLLSIAGIALISVVENSGGQVQFIGVIFLIAAVISGSAYGVISRGISDEFSVYERTYFMQLMGGVFYTVLAFAEHRGDLGAIIAPLANADFVAAVLYLSLGASVAGYSLFNYAVANAPMANVISLCNLTTVISVAAGIVLLGEPFSPVSLIAMFAVLVGIWGVQKFPPKEQN
ncbi:MAG: DMT family transporter [Oscillospiraceae bacterium]|nr:DMT family transporter [Oscillospiraceae bacterium]